MSQRLGESLIKEGLINRDQLLKALERQVIFGGRIGTNLVELGFIKEEDLTQFLSKFLNIPYADPSYFEDIDSAVLGSISPEIAEKYLVMPIKKDKNRVHLAMLDPKDFNALDEIRFITGYEIIPYIASELRLLLALEKYYNIRRDLRYVTIIRKEAEGTQKKEETTKEQPSEKSKEKTDEKITKEERKEESIKKINLSLINAEDREEIAGILINEASGKLKRVALFVVKGENVSGWKGRGLNLDDRFISGINIPLNQLSLFKDVIDGKSFHTGPLLKVPLNDWFLNDMGSLFPQEVIAFPLTIRGKVVSILYGDNGDRALLLGEFDDLKNMMLMASMAMEMLILKKKIMEL